jgi:prolipoprotein diacylglyceryltransferase
MIVAVAVACRRYRRSGGRAGVILDVAAWAVPFGLAGALVHTILLDSRRGFGDEYRLWHAATVGVAAIGVPGAVALGAAGAWIACRRSGVAPGPVAGAAAPALAFGLAVAGLGNWWAQQFYGPPSAWWWTVRISPEHRVPGYENYATFQPAFAYLSLWEVALGFAVIWAAGRFALSGERAFMLCAAGYAVGGFGVESLRVGPLPHALGMRYGALGDIAVFVLAVLGMYLTRPGRRPPARGQARRAVVEDSPGDVMSV